MGLLDFTKNIGEKLFDREQDASAKIQQKIHRQNPGIEQLEVQVNNGVASLKGKATNAIAVEKAALLAGNIQGIEKVEINALDAPAVDANAQFYEIQAGDTLAKIAERIYGDSKLHQDIFEANQEVIQDPDKIYAGQKIRLPRVAVA